VSFCGLLGLPPSHNFFNLRAAWREVRMKLIVNTFSVPYILMEVPMNLLMKRLGANYTLPIMVVLWGVVTACQGAVKSYSGLLACRFFLGALEGISSLSLFELKPEL
jgi:hypothetical protein